MQGLLCPFKSTQTCRHAVISLASVVDHGTAVDQQQMQANLHHVHHALRTAFAVSVLSLALSPPAAAKMYEWRPRRHYKRLGQLREDANSIILNQAGLCEYRVANA